MIRFAVDDVVPSLERHPERPLRSRLAELVDGEILVTSADVDVVAIDDHPLVGAVRHAFDHHHRLRWTPDAVWLTIAQGLAHHVALHAEELRPRFVRHEGKRTLRVRTNGFGREDWAEAIEGFADAIAADQGDAFRLLVECDFSTTSPEARIASQIVLMDALHRYYDYVVDALCGIPEIVVTGTPEDWRLIRDRVEMLAEYGLSTWTEALLPLCEQWIATAEGHPSLRFWTSIAKPREFYGPKVLTGWITQLFPYLEDDQGRPTLPNPALVRGSKPWEYGGLAPSCFPPAPSCVLVRLEGVDGVKEVKVLGGLLSVVQDADGFVEPHVGWAVAALPLDRLLERIVTDHEAEAPIPRGADLERLHGIAGEALAIAERCDGAALFGGRARLRALASQEPVGPDQRALGVRTDLPRRLWTVDWRRFVDFDEGRGLVYGLVRVPGSERHEAWVVAVGADGEVHAHTPIVAKSLQAALRLLLEHEGRPWFDAPDYVPHARLGDALSIE